MSKEQKRIHSEKKKRIRNLLIKSPNAYLTKNIHKVNKHFLLQEFIFLKEIMQNEEIEALIKYIVDTDREVRDVKKIMREENEIELDNHEKEMIKILTQQHQEKYGYEPNYQSNVKKLKDL